MTLNQLRDRVHAANKKWWISLEDGVTPLQRNRGELLAVRPLVGSLVVLT